MPVTIDDLKPKNFKINVNGVELECKPLRLSHALSIAKIGNVFQDTKNVSRAEIKQAEKDIDEVIAELIPDLAGVQLEMSVVMKLIEQLMENIDPSDNKELKDNGVELNTDPKV